MLEVRETPGHTPESISVVVYEHAADARAVRRCSPATPCSSATSAAPTCSPRTGVTADGARPPAVPLAARPAADPARRHPGVPRPRRRLGVRQEPLDRDGVDDRRAARGPTTRCQPMTEDEFVAAVTDGQPTAPGYFSFDAAPQPADPHPCSTRRPPPSLDHRRGARRPAGRRRRGRHPRPGGRSPPATSGARSTSGWTAGSPSTSARSSRPRPTIVLVTEPGDEGEAKIRLARIGFDRVRRRPRRRPAQHSSTTPSWCDRAVPADRVELARRAARRDRRDSSSSTSATPARRRPGTIPGAVTIPLAALRDRVGRARPGPRRSSSTAPAATARRSPPASCAPPARPTSPTSSAATAPGAPLTPIALPTGR